MYYVYILLCRDKTFYIGSTHNIEKRLFVHNQGKGAKYTRGRLPVTLCYTESFSTKGEALRREAELKTFSRAKKEALMALVY